MNVRIMVWDTDRVSTRVKLRLRVWVRVCNKKGSLVMAVVGLGLAVAVGSGLGASRVSVTVVIRVRVRVRVDATKRGPW